MTETEVFRYFMPEEPLATSSPTEGCWDWRGGLTDSGYGVFWMGSKPIRAHRMSYQIYHGSLRDDLMVLHSCDRPICCQPVHLSQGNCVQNAREMVERGRAMEGMKSSAAKLTDEQVLWIRSSTLSHDAMANLLGVNQSTVTRICQGKTWKHLL